MIDFFKQYCTVKMRSEILRFSERLSQQRKKVPVGKDF